MDVPSCCMSPPTSFRLRKSHTFIISSVLPDASHFPPPGDAATALTHDICAGKMNTGFNIGVEVGLPSGSVNIPCNP